MAGNVRWTNQISPEVLHRLFIEGYTVVWRSEGGWVWHPEDGWVWRAKGGLVVISRRRLWNVFAKSCAGLGVDDRWIERQPPPEQLTASEQADLDLLMQQPPPVSKATAKKLIGGGTDRFLKIWRLFPIERKLKRGAPRGHRFPDATGRVLGPREK